MCKKKQTKPKKAQSTLSKKERKKAEKLEKKRLELQAQEALSAELNEQKKSDQKKGKKGEKRKKQTTKRKHRKTKGSGESKKQLVLDAEALKKREHDFVLDCIAVAQLSKDGAQRNPKVDSVIPTYDALRDPFSASYFQQPTVKKFLEKMNLMHHADEEIKVRENEYLRRRNVHGCGRSIEEYGGHGVTIRL